MFVQLPTLSTVPTGAVDLTYDFAPLFFGLVVGLGLCVLALVLLIGAYDAWGLSRQQKPPTEQPASAPELPNAA